MRNKLIACFFVLTTVFVFIIPASADVHVNSYFKGNGEYVHSYYRSNPDGNSWNNYSSYGNYNPYTGKEGTKWPKY